jgi:hypothetical protein
MTQAPTIPGMTLRDHFASQVLAGWLSTFGPDYGEPEPPGIAALCYDIADAMMRQRNAPFMPSAKPSR